MWLNFLIAFAEIMWEEAGDKVLDETICKLRHDQKSMKISLIIITLRDIMF